MATVGNKPQLGLFDCPHNGTETSKAAAESMKPLVMTLKQRVFDAIKAHGHHGLTSDELEQVTGLRHQTASARMRELVLEQKLEKVGKRATRSGRQAFAWRARQNLSTE